MAFKKVLIVDDSALMRRQLSLLFTQAGGYDIQCARHGKEAVLLNRSYQPDVVLLDINMPEMDGLTALSQIMTERPVPVVMLSSLTEKGALVTFEALALGAVDYIAKPGGTISLTLAQIETVLLEKVATALQANLGSPRAALARTTVTPSVPMPAIPTPPAHRRHAQADAMKHTPVANRAASPGQAGSVDVVIVGVSTGNPKTLEFILPKLPADFPCPVVVAQHMPAKFTLSFAQRMQAMCAMQVSELARLSTLQPGHVYICKGGADVMLARRGQQLLGVVKPEHPGYLWHPSVEVLATSALQACQPERVVGVMLTGMGNDGASAFCTLKQRGARTIAESESTAVVYGMPGELVRQGGATTVLPAPAVADQLVEWICH